MDVFLSLACESQACYENTGKEREREGEREEKKGSRQEKGREIYSVKL